MAKRGLWVGVIAAGVLFAARPGDRPSETTSSAPPRVAIRAGADGGRADRAPRRKRSFKTQARVAPWHADDGGFLDTFSKKLAELARAGKALSPDELKKKIESDRRGRVKVTPPDSRALTPEEVYRHALPSVFVLGSVKKPAKEGDEVEEGWFATAWAVAEDGVLVTNCHVFDDADGLYFGAANHKGDVFPLADVLAVNRKADVAVVRVDGRGFTPLPLADEPAEVGSWVGVLSHPGHLLYTFTQGHVTRYGRGNADEGRLASWMGVTAEYAGGSSGAPVLDRHGSVVGMAAETLNIDYEDEAPPTDKPGDKPKEKDKAAPQPAESRVQMIVKMAVPASQFRRAVGARRQP